MPSNTTAAAIAALPDLCRATLAGADGRYINIDSAAIQAYAERLTAAEMDALMPLPPAPAEAAAPPAERVALIMAQMAVNFCYFPTIGDARWWVLSVETGEPIGQDDEANAMTAALKTVWLQQLAVGEGFGSGSFLAALADDAAAELFKPAPGAGVLPMLAQRAAALRELGAALLSAGGVTAFFAQAGGDAASLAGLLASACPTFDDKRHSGGTAEAPRVLRFLKRAQLCAGALAGAALPGFELAGVERLTV